jgi:hypothetical protein
MTRLGRKQRLTFVLGLAGLDLLAGCAGGLQSLNPAAAPAQACGDPCATVSCPSAFRCTWNTQCIVRCEPVPMSNP